MKDEGGRMTRKTSGCHRSRYAETCALPAPAQHRSRSTATCGTRCLLILLSFAPLLTGCTVDEKKEVALYRDILDRAGAKHVEYHASDALTLTDALLLANQHNERLMIAGED